MKTFTEILLEELQGANVTPASPGVQTGKAPSIQLKKQPGAANGVPNGPAMVANGVQTAADQAQAGAVNTMQNQIAQQQGMQDPAQVDQVNKQLAVQPRQAKPTPTAQARGMRQDATQNRNFGVGGKPVTQANEQELPAGAAKELANPDDKENYNEKKDEPRAAQRAKEIMPGAKDPKMSTFKQEDTTGKGKQHRIAGEKKTTVEAVFAAPDSKSILDEVFGG